MEFLSPRRKRLTPPIFSSPVEYFSTLLAVASQHCCDCIAAYCSDEGAYMGSVDALLAQLSIGSAKLSKNDIVRLQKKLAAAGVRGFCFGSHYLCECGASMTPTAPDAPITTFEFASCREPEASGKKRRVASKKFRRTLRLEYIGGCVLSATFKISARARERLGRVPGGKNQAGWCRTRAVGGTRNGARFFKKWIR